jgi:hypothetical protein
LNDNGCPFDGWLIYQRRANVRGITLGGCNLSLRGTLYAKWAQLDLSEGGTHQAQFIADSLRSSGKGTVTLDDADSLTSANEVFLDE